MSHATLEASPAGAELLAYVLSAGDRRLVCLRSQLPLISADAPTEWVHVAYEGEWHGHRSGSFKFTRERFEEAIANHERQKNAAKLDFDHETDVAPAGASVPARGWVHRLEVREQGGIAHLWALVEFGPEAVRKNRDGGYRFCSGVFDFNATDRVTGEPIGMYMPRLSLTDDPFIDGQTPILLSRAAALALTNGATMVEIDKSEFISRARKLEGDALTIEQITKLAQSMGLLKEAMGGGSKGAEPEPDAPDEPAAMSAASATDAPAEPVAAAADAPPAQAPEAPPADAETAEAGSLLEQAMAALGLDLPGLVEALRGLLAGTEASAATTAPLSAKIDEQALLLSARDKTITALSTRVETAEAEVKRYREAEADAAVDVLIESGRVLDNGRDEMRALYLSNRKAFDTLSAALPPAVPVGEHASSQTPPTADSPAINEDDRWVKERRRILSATWLGQRGKDAVDAAIRRELAARNSNGVRV